MSPSSDPSRVSPPSTLTEAALQLGGKTDEEVRRTGALDRADQQVESLFRPEYQTSASPLHRAVWESRVPWEMFQALQGTPSPQASQVMERSLEIVAHRRAAGALYDAEGKLDPMLVGELGAIGYWGLLVDRAYGGQQVPLSIFLPFLTRMATLSPTVAGLASVHGCIGAIDPLQTFGTAEQCGRLLPDLAQGRRLSAFALTEPQAGSDLTQLRTTARRDGDSWLVTGEKLFITNAAPGRIVALVCLIDRRPEVLLGELPPEEGSGFTLRSYGLHALRHSQNRGIILRDFRIPESNRLETRQGDGLTIAYHGLNRGRIAVCAHAAGTMRRLLASMAAWATRRVTYGQPIARRELVQRRLGRLAALIVGCDALTLWCASLLDQGYRGELECIVAKVFGSEALKEAAVDLALKTHGGRSFLHGHLVGDYLHDYLAPCIYEGEGELLGLALFRGLVKQHGATYFEPLMRAVRHAGLSSFNPRHPGHLWKVRQAAWPYARWLLGQAVRRPQRPSLDHLPASLSAHVGQAMEGLSAMGRELDQVLRRHQIQLPDRQCRLSELATRIQKLVVLMCVSLHAANQPDETVRLAADVLGRDLTRELTGRRPSDEDFRRVTRLGDAVASGAFPSLQSVPCDEPLIPYTP